MIFSPDLAPSAIAAVCVLSVIAGWLIPRRTYKDLLESNRIKDQQLAEKDRQLALLYEVGGTMHDIMLALHKIASENSGDQND